MSMAFGGPGGGGRGFSYRSSHQQGQDGQRQGQGQGQQPSRRRRRKQRKHGRSNKRNLQCSADIFVPENLRKLLIGKGGVTIQQLIKSCSQEHYSSNVTIHVPPRRRADASTLNDNSNTNNTNNRDEDDRPVRVKAETVASLLHACWRILHALVVKRGGAEGAVMTTSKMACHVRIPSSGPCLMGRLGRTNPFFVGGGDDSSTSTQNSKTSICNTTTMLLSVYCVQSFLDDQQVDTLVDNERFANPEVTAHYETVYQDEINDDDEHEHEHDHADGQQPSSLLFVYGTAEQQPERLYQALQQATVQLWQQEQLLEQQQQQQPALIANLMPSSQQQQQQQQPEESFTVGTYNLLHPVYAELYQEAAGVDRILGKSNWLSFRVSAIYRTLLSSQLDIYLLQEVDAQAFKCLSNDDDNNDNHDSGGLRLKQLLLERYKFIHYVHPGRNANDSVALLIRKERFAVLKQEFVPFTAKGNTDVNDKDTSQEQEHYMCAAIVLVKDLKTQRRYRVASTHFCPNKARHAEQTLLEFLIKNKLIKVDDNNNDNNTDSSRDAGSNDDWCDAIIWGGDCNNEYKSPNSNLSTLFSGYTTIQDSAFHDRLKNEHDNNETQEGILTNQQGNRPHHEQQPLNPQRRRCTRGPTCIDWIFFSTPNNNNDNSKSEGRLQGCRSTISKAFVHATGRCLEPTGYPASDHLGEAVTLYYNAGQISQALQN